MDAEFLSYYQKELQYIRELGGEFARENPKIAGRLGLDEFECADPYVERLLEGFSFLAARIQLKIDSDFSRFTQHLLEMVYPHYLAPVPSMVIAQFQPDLNDGSFTNGLAIPKDTILKSITGKDDPTECEYRTGNDISIWPLELVDATYIANAGAFTGMMPSFIKKVRAAIKLKIRATAGLNINQLSLDKLSFFIRGQGDLPMRIYEQIFANSAGIMLQNPKERDSFNHFLTPSSIKRVGFENNEALIPYSGRSFHGYRLLQEYFSFPERFMFFQVNDLQKVAPLCKGSEFDIYILLNKCDTFLENRISNSNFLLNCVSAINLFPKRADRIFISGFDHEYHILPDKTRPLDFEVYDVQHIVGHGKNGYKQEFLPFYSQTESAFHTEKRAYYTIRREPRKYSSKQKIHGPRSSYTGGEVFISLVDAFEAPFSSELRELELKLMCTNRDLPLHMPVGKTMTDFKMVSGLPVDIIKCVAGPTWPKPSYARKETSWRLISHLTMNYLSLIDKDGKQNAESLKDILNLYGDVSEPSIKKQIEGVVSVISTPITRRLPLQGPIAFGRGLEIKITLEEAAFEGLGIFLFGAVLNLFFKKYVSINSFVETVVSTMERGEIIRWPLEMGRRQIL